MNCNRIRISYNSCRDRHCPKCQGPQRAEWLAQRLERWRAARKQLRDDEAT